MDNYDILEEGIRGEMCIDSLETELKELREAVALYFKSRDDWLNMDLRASTTPTAIYKHAEQALLKLAKGNDE